MPSIGETAWAEMFARLEAAPDYGIATGRIRRTRRTDVPREESPAVYLIEGQARVIADKACNWQWQMDGTVAIIVRDDAALAAADPFVIAVVNRINPEIGTPYSNGANLTLLRIGADTEIADADATRIDVDFRFTFGTLRWTLDQPEA